MSMVKAITNLIHMIGQTSFVKNNLPILTPSHGHGQFDTKTKIDPTQECKWDIISQWDYCKKGLHVLFPNFFFI
jgi:hypothetical protein